MNTKLALLLAAIVVVIGGGTAVGTYYLSTGYRAPAVPPSVTTTPATIPPTVSQNAASSSQNAASSPSESTPASLAQTLPPSKLSCSVGVTSTRGSHQFSGTSEQNQIVITPGEQIHVTWASTAAVSALVTTAGAVQDIDVNGQGTYSVPLTGAFTYTFTGKDGASVQCGFFVRIVQMAYDSASLSATSSTPTITGVSSGMSSVQLEVEKPVGYPVLFTSPVTPVTNGHWRIPITTALPDGTYTLMLRDGVTGTAIYAASLVVSAQGTGSLSVAPTVEPADASVSPGKAVDVVALTVTDDGSGPVRLSGFNLQYSGTAPRDVITTVAVADDTGGNAGATGGQEGSSPFGTSSFTTVPFGATLAPGESHVYTISVALSKYAAPQAGRTFSLSVLSIGSNTSVIHGTLPISGGTFTIAAQ